MAEIIGVYDLPESIQSTELVQLLVDGANAKAIRVAPCLGDIEEPPTADQLAEAKLILAGAVRRWSESGSGAFQQQTTGPFSMSVDTRQRTGFNFWPSEIEQLQAICKGAEEESLAFSIDTAPTCGADHSPICSLMFGASYCSCGADLAGAPLYEEC